MRATNGFYWPPSSFDDGSCFAAAAGASGRFRSLRSLHPSQRLLRHRFAITCIRRAPPSDEPRVATPSEAPAACRLSFYLRPVPIAERPVRHRFRRACPPPDTGRGRGPQDTSSAKSGPRESSLLRGDAAERSRLWEGPECRTPKAAERSPAGICCLTARSRRIKEG